MEMRYCYIQCYRGSIYDEMFQRAQGLKCGKENLFVLEGSDVKCIPDGNHWSRWSAGLGGMNTLA